MSVIGYGRCSTAEQASNGASIEVQRCAVERVAEINGRDLTWLADEGVSGAAPPESRKAVKAALALLEARESEALIFTRSTAPAAAPRTSPACRVCLRSRGGDGVHQPKDLGPRAVAPGRGLAIDGPEKARDPSTNSRGLIHDRRGPLCQPIS